GEVRGAGRRRRRFDRGGCRPVESIRQRRVAGRCDRHPLYLCGVALSSEGFVNLRQLEYFVAIAEEGSFTRAAERLFVAQPSLSQQMKSLERELGGQLLERLPKGVRLTAAGKVFLKGA